MMARFVLVCLILAEILMVQAVLGIRSDGSELNPPKVKVNVPHRILMSRIAGQPASSPAESSEGQEQLGAAEAPGIRWLLKHHSSDKSVAGGDVIIGGLVTAIFAVVFCYIRVTRKRTGDH